MAEQAFSDFADAIKSVYHNFLKTVDKYAKTSFYAGYGGDMFKGNDPFGLPSGSKSRSGGTYFSSESGGLANYVSSGNGPSETTAGAGVGTGWEFGFMTGGQRGMTGDAHKITAYAIVGSISYTENIYDDWGIEISVPGPGAVGYGLGLYEYDITTTTISPEQFEDFWDNMMDSWDYGNNSSGSNENGSTSSDYMEPNFDWSWADEW